MNIECCICYDKLTNGQEIKSTLCGHLFHGECIMLWIPEETSTCPECRGIVSKTNLRNIYLNNSRSVNILDSTIVTNLCNVHDELCNEQKNLVEKIETLQAENNELTLRNTMLVNSVRHHRNQVNASKVTIDELTEKNKKLEAEMTKYKVQVVNFKSKVLLLNSKMDLMEKDYKKNIITFDTEKDAFKEQLQQSKKRFESNNKKLNATIQSLETENGILTQKYLKYKNKVIDMGLKINNNNNNNENAIEKHVKVKIEKNSETY